MSEHRRLVLAIVAAIIVLVVVGAVVASEAIGSGDPGRVCVSTVGPVTVGPGDEVTGETVPVTECFDH